MDGVGAVVVSGGEVGGVGRTASGEQDARARARNGRLDRARARRLVLDKGRAERDARIDAAVADVYQAQEDQAAAGQAIVEADRRIGEAIRRLIVEGITTAQAAQLCELSVTAVQRLKAESADLPGEPVTSSLSMVARTSVVGSSDAGSASAAGVVA